MGSGKGFRNYAGVFSLDPKCLIDPKLLLVELKIGERAPHAGVYEGCLNIKILLKNECPHIIMETPGMIFALARQKLSLKIVRHFILDEYGKMLKSLGMPVIFIFQHLLELFLCMLRYEERAVIFT